MSGEADAPRDIARAAVALLRDRGANSGAGPFTYAGERDGRKLAVSLSGPDLPADVPAGIAPIETIRSSVTWRGDYALKIEAPRTVFEIEWSAGEPMRIMVFSRGEWENAFLPKRD